MVKKPKYLPTPEEIKCLTAEIRNAWSDEEEELRSHGVILRGRGNPKMKKHWTPPMYHLSLSKADGLVADRID